MYMPLLAANELFIEGTTVSELDTGKFYIVIDNDITVNGLNLILHYDHTLIRLLNINTIDLGLPFAGSDGNVFEENKINLLLFDEAGSFLNADSGKIFEVSFVLNDTSLSVDTTAQIEYIKGSVGDNNLMNVDFNYSNGDIIIIPTIVPVTKNELPKIPKTFELKQNYPNPFNPSTIIPFTIPTLSRVSLTIYNILGQKVDVILDKKRFKPGWYEYSYNTYNLASGAYFYRIDAEPFSTGFKRFMKTKKMIHVK